MILDMLLRDRAARARLHDRHRRAVPGDATRRGSASRTATACTSRWRTRTPPDGTPWSGPEHCCTPRRSTRSSARSPAPTPGSPASAASRPTTRADAELVEADAKRGGIWKYNPLADWTEKDVWRLHPRARPALPPAARPGLRVDRLRALHAARRRPRGPLGRAPTRPSADCTSRLRRDRPDDDEVHVV